MTNLIKKLAPYVFSGAMAFGMIGCGDKNSDLESKMQEKKQLDQIFNDLEEYSEDVEDASYFADYNEYVDLNGNGIEDKVMGDFSETHTIYNTETKTYERHKVYDLTVRIANFEGKWGAPRLLARLEDKPGQIGYADIDDDGFLDVVYTQVVRTNAEEKLWETFVVINDGRGNFNNPESMYKEKITKIK